MFVSVLALLSASFHTAAFQTASSRTTTSEVHQPSASADYSTIRFGPNITSNISSLLPEIRDPIPNQTLGLYIDQLAGSILGPRDLAKRRQIHTSTLLTSSWTHNKVNYNISADKCLELGDVAGIYTNTNGTINNATILDIINDLKLNLGSRTKIKYLAGSRILDNAYRATAEANAYLQRTLCGQGSGAGINTHDELRHLLASDGFVIALMIKSFAFSGVGAGVYTGILNRNATLGQAAGVALSAAGLVILDGIVTRLQVNGILNQVEALTIGVFTSWLRRAMIVAADSQESLCVPEVVVHNGMGALPLSRDPSLYFDAFEEIDLRDMSCSK